MRYLISQALAQEIAETVKEICGYEVNYINTEGSIFASTNAKRIGQYHEAGHKAAQTGAVMEAENDDDYWGTQRGVNIPVTYHKEICGVIGISGDPSEVRKYAELARRITRLLLREQELEKQKFTRRTENSYVLQQLITGQDISREYLEEYLVSAGLSPRDRYRAAVLRLNHGYRFSEITSFEYDMEQKFSELRFQEHKKVIFSYRYPNEYCMIFPVAMTGYVRNQLDSLLCKYEEILGAGIGSAANLSGLPYSYQAAGLSAANSKPGCRQSIMFDELDLEILLGNLGKEAILQYHEKTLSHLTEEEKSILKIYYENEMSLKKTGEILYLHKNTLQYKLDRIAEKTSFNPRQFQTAVVLYLALKLDTSINLDTLRE